MHYKMTNPCDACPFLKSMKRGFSMRRLLQFAGGEFPCHKTAEIVEDEEHGGSEFHAKEDSAHCAGALIFLEKRNQSHQMMRISERLGAYDRTKLNMEADVR